MKDAAPAIRQPAEILDVSFIERIQCESIIGRHLTVEPIGKTKVEPILSSRRDFIFFGHLLSQRRSARLFSVVIQFQISNCTTFLFSENLPLSLLRELLFKFFHRLE